MAEERTPEELQAEIDKAVSERVEQELAGLKEKNAQLMDEAKEAKRKLQEIDLPEGVTPEDIKTILEEREQQRIKLAEEKGQYKELLAETENRYKEAMAKQKADSEKHVSELVKSLETKEVSIQNYIRDNQIANSIAQAKANPSLLTHVVAEHTKIVEEDGKYELHVIDPNSGARRVGSDGNHMDLKGLHSYLVEQPEYAAAYPGSKAAGGGAKGTQSGGGNIANPFAKDTLNLTEQGRLQREDPGLAAQLRGSAG